LKEQRHFQAVKLSSLKAVEFQHLAPRSQHPSITNFKKGILMLHEKQAENTLADKCDQNTVKDTNKD